MTVDHQLSPRFARALDRPAPKTRSQAYRLLVRLWWAVAVGTVETWTCPLVRHRWPAQPLYLGPLHGYRWVCPCGRRIGPRVY